MLLSFDIFEKNKNLLNKINVFPVADGDTGNNLLSAVSSLRCFDFKSIKDLSKLNINDIMMSGRGCSGNIFSLYLIGLYNNVSDNLTDMFRKASDFAWSTMYNPVEGTILTAMKSVPEEYSSLEDFFYRYIQNTYESLMKGPDLLQVLKDNHTLDSGTLGFLYILCDVYKCLTNKDISPNIDISEPLYINNDCVNDRYCVEISLISNRHELKQILSKEGSELVYLTSGDKIKLHIHTDNYIRVFELCKEFGQITDYKIEDMLNNNGRISY